MAKFQNVYKDKDTKNWFYKKRLPKDNPSGKAWAIKKGFKTASEARKALDAYLMELENTEIKKGEFITASVTLEAFVKNVVWGEWERKLKQSSMLNKKEQCKYIFNYFEGKTFDGISKKDIAKFKNHLLNYDSRSGEKLKSMTINLALCSLAQIYDIACEHELVPENIARQVKGVSQKPKTKIDYWTLPEFENFLSMIDDSTDKGFLQKLGFYMLFFTGMRIGELMARKWSDIDWDNNAIYIDSTLRYVNAGDWSADPKDGVKTTSSKAWVKLTPKTMDLLKVWKKKQATIGKMDYIIMLKGVMYSPVRWRNWKSWLVKKWNEQASKEAQLKNIRVHDLRDSHAMFLMMNGADIKTVQDALRHTKATTTLNYYVGKLPDVGNNILQQY